MSLDKISEDILFNCPFTGYVVRVTFKCDPSIKIVGIISSVSDKKDCISVYTPGTNVISDIFNGINLVPRDYYMSYYSLDIIKCEELNKLKTLVLNTIDSENNEKIKKVYLNVVKKIDEHITCTKRNTNKLLIFGYKRYPTRKKEVFNFVNLGLFSNDTIMEEKQFVFKNNRIKKKQTKTKFQSLSSPLPSRQQKQQQQQQKQKQNNSSVKPLPHVYSQSQIRLNKKYDRTNRLKNI